MVKLKKLSKQSKPQPSTETNPVFGFQPSRAERYEMGKSNVFDIALADFSIAYADQSERDHEVLVKAVQENRLEVFVEEE
jgi:hypothetical protein